MTDKTKLVFKLKLQGAFWSYSSEALPEIPDKVLIEEALRCGDVEEILHLFGLFPYEEIKMVWTENLVPDERIYAHNYYLSKVFFGVEEAKQYIESNKKKYNRYERIRQFNT